MRGIEAAPFLTSVKQTGISGGGALLMLDGMRV